MTYTHDTHTYDNVQLALAFNYPRLHRHTATPPHRYTRLHPYTPFCTLDSPLSGIRTAVRLYIPPTPLDPYTAYTVHTVTPSTPSTPLHPPTPFIRDTTNLGYFRFFFMDTKKTMVFGASPNPSRYAHLAVRQLEKNGIEVVALGRRAGQIGNTTILTDYPAKIDHLHTISLYLGAKHQPEYYDYLISLKPKRVLFNPGTENPDFVARLERAGIESEMACTLALLSIGAY